MNPADSNNAKGKNHADRDLREIREAWNSLQQPDPPELVDQAVLNAARRELAGRRRGGIRWIGGFATAAIVVLALSLTLLQDEKPPLTPTAEPDGLKLDQAAPSARSRELRKSPALQDAGEAEIPMSRDGKREQFNLDAVAEKRALQAPAAARAADSANVDMDEEDRAMEEFPAPEAWIEQLEQLRQSQDSARFQQELEAFLAVYPDYPLPPGWRED